jgi:hypothetical protein
LLAAVVVKAGLAEKVAVGWVAQDLLLQVTVWPLLAVAVEQEAYR